LIETAQTILSYELIVCWDDNKAGASIAEVAKLRGVHEQTARGYARRVVVMH